MTESRQKGGGERIVGGGSKNVFGEGFYAEFTVCFPPPRVFHPPLPLSDKCNDFLTNDTGSARDRHMGAVVCRAQLDVPCEARVEQRLYALRECWAPKPPELQ